MGSQQLEFRGGLVVEDSVEIASLFISCVTLKVCNALLRSLGVLGLEFLIGKIEIILK